MSMHRRQLKLTQKVHIKSKITDYVVVKKITLLKRSVINVILMSKRY